jgi:protocatechuate 3,4-dioxygenase, beta subunit
MVLRKEKLSRSPDAFSIVMVNRLAVLASRSGKPIASAATPMPTIPNPAPLDPNFVGCVGIRCGDDGIYRIKTIKPGAYPAGPDWMRPPHIHFEVHGHFERLVTQMYFPGEPLNAHDRLLNSAPRPELLVATYPSPQGPPGLRVLNFDIVLSRG